MNETLLQPSPGGFGGSEKPRHRAVCPTDTGSVRVTSVTGGRAPVGRGAAGHRHVIPRRAPAAAALFREVASRCGPGDRQRRRAVLAGPRSVTGRGQIPEHGAAGDENPP